MRHRAYEHEHPAGSALDPDDENASEFELAAEEDRCDPDAAYDAWRDDRDDRADLEDATWD